MRIGLNLCINKERVDVLTMLGFLIHEHNMCLHLIRPFYISFVSAGYFSSYESCLYLLKFTAKYFTFERI